MHNPDITATLKDARIAPWFGDTKVAVGKIFADANERFPDGEQVRTSAIITGPDADGIITTNSGSTYRLEMAASA
jgi:hypothetical protein